ncbi:MAG: DNA mismatch repair protein MutS [Dehalococcoidia bacterium]|jgi:DNA mismatch repair protein MutS|nr:DNA mismatch repair protein MutS [Dehalococcoidia bacterium]MDP7213955.1 DNA mismatch repair protein MutS [Dehalococcoidia bacterium]MDP7514423.1 DNA mismatch repair protein MutS [Dehalococcoidia bacterium]
MTGISPTAPDADQTTPEVGKSPKPRKSRANGAARSGKTRLSPGRRQYLDIKAEHPDALLLVRMGDFYETFDEDAQVMAEVLDIALTARDVGGGARSPLAGIPYHSLESYLGQLIAAGLKVAICEQTSDPATAKGIVDRAVVRLVTPGTVLEPGLLDNGRNNYLAAAVVDGERAGVAYIDVTTSEFVTRDLPLELLHDELDAIGPAEVIVDAEADAALGDPATAGYVRRPMTVVSLDANLAGDRLRRHFGTATLEPFGCESKPLAVMAAAAVLEFLRETQLGSLPQVTTLRTMAESGFMLLDRRARRDLEVFDSLGDREGAPTLLGTLDHTRSPLGKRLLRERLARPLMELEELNKRQDGAELWLAASGPRASARDLLGKVSDLERLTNRVRAFTATPRDLTALARGLGQLPGLIETAKSAEFDSGITPLEDAHALIEAAIADDPPISAGGGDAIRPGFDAELDELRTLSGEAQSYIAGLEATAREDTGIRSLKVGYNKVFGYYIEVSRTNLDAVPEVWDRRQSLVGAERFITPELKEYEAKVLMARDRISEVERSIFRRVCGEVGSHADRIMAGASAVAKLDVLCALAQAAADGGWVRPELDDGDDIDIKAGRHPVVETALGPGRFVPNDIHLSSNAQQVAIITGPNMAGKSTYIRQVAVLVLMAQVGSFIPAESARIGLVDRIFTRSGLTDDIAGGQSTFMVEMVETAAILNQATTRSLIVLDEIGRGTSTYDGLSIAWSVAEHIHNSPRLGCKTLFATHYHEMTALADMLPRAVNYQVSVSEEDGEVVFLHHIVPGGADRSYGVHVGRLAGLPPAVIARAWDLLAKLESNGRLAPTGSGYGLDSGLDSGPGLQLSFMSGPSPVEGALARIDVPNLTPLQAITELYRLQEMAEGQSDGDGSGSGD